MYWYVFHRIELALLVGWMLVVANALRLLRPSAETMFTRERLEGAVDSMVVGQITHGH